MWCRDFREWVFQTLPLLLLTFVSILFFYMIDTGWVPADVIVTGTRWTHWTNVRNYFTSFYVLCLCRKCAVLWLRLLSSRWNVVRFSSARVMQIFYSPPFLFTQTSYKYVFSVCGVADGWSWKRRVRPARSDTDSLQFQSRYSHAKVCVGRVRCCRRLVSETKGAPCSVQQLALCNSNLVFLMQKYLTKSICALFVLCRACALL